MVQKESSASNRPRESSKKHLISFFWMILFTAAAFVVVATEAFSGPVTLAIILVLAAIQAVLQLFTFMHLDRRSQLPILFMASGIGLGVIFALSLWIWK
ncbi:hypothetical protein GCM10011571_06930 [Marinithermofilum abyssi]|uniref:Cytochrome c oxidase subunit 4 n=1 Tax=Marinithermofilum abyssi TaxID=1571185 RepID=A0A8J2VGK8_9BACL|nr:cytochrome C oxidase subunit IV family protein [Marinithermofilum abyssi]GGE08292.1 hypothetical protein GCM10011571_06930 [Marinithermofilum abyssi]